MLTKSKKLLNAVKKLYTKVTGGKTTKSNDLPTVIDSMAENYKDSNTTYTAGTGISITENNVINNTQDAVIANPTLAGTEATLTGIQVGDTKFAVPQGGGSGGSIYRYNIRYVDSSFNAIDDIIILSSTDYDFGEIPVVSSLMPEISQAQMKILFDFASLINNQNILIETLDKSTYHNNTHHISSDLHGYIIENVSTSQNVVYIDIAYDETTDTYSFDTSYSQVIGGVSITKITL